MQWWTDLTLPLSVVCVKPLCHCSRVVFEQAWAHRDLPWVWWRAVCEASSLEEVLGGLDQLWLMGMQAQMEVGRDRRHGVAKATKSGVGLVERAGSPNHCRGRSIGPRRNSAQPASCQSY
jgi:hypothetical protein